MKKRLLFIALCLCAFNIKSAKSNGRVLNPVLGTESSKRHRKKADPTHESFAEVRRRMSTFSGGDAAAAPPLPPRRATVATGSRVYHPVTDSAGYVADMPVARENFYYVSPSLNGKSKGGKLKSAPRPPDPPPRGNAAVALRAYKPTDGDVYLEPTAVSTLVDQAEQEFARLNLYDNEFEELEKDV